MDLTEVVLELGVEKLRIAAFEDFCDEISFRLQCLYTNIECCYEKLRLNILVHVVKTSDVRCSVADHQVSKVVFELLQDVIYCLSACDVTHELNHIVNWCHFLKINCHNSGTWFLKESLSS